MMNVNAVNGLNNNGPHLSNPNWKVIYLIVNLFVF